MVYNQIINYII